MRSNIRPFLAAACAAMFLGIAGAQQTPPASTHDPDVFLDNHRPLIQKKDKAPTSKTVSGQVVDDSGQPLNGALVTLTDDKTKEKRTYFTKKDGRYTFEELNFNNDYDITAKWKAFSSEERKLSQYDHAAKIVRILEVKTPEGAPPPGSEAKKEEPK